MTTFSPELSMPNDDTLLERRIGKTAYWLQFLNEQATQSSSWRLSLLQKPARQSKANPPLVLIQFTPLKPLFTFETEDHSYSLSIDNVKLQRNGKIGLSGARKVGAGLTKTLHWTAVLLLAEVDGVARIAVEARFRVVGPDKQPMHVQVRVPFTAYQPTILEQPLPVESRLTATVVWSGRGQTSAALIFRASQVERIVHNGGVLLANVSTVDYRGKNPIEFSLALRQAKSAGQSLQLVRREAADQTPPLVPPRPSAPASILAAARNAIRRMQDSRGCTTMGKERWYYRVREGFEYCPGYPYFTAEASPVLIKWGRFYQNEIAERTANLTARGTAADFAVSVGEPGAEGNKGAFWDYAAGPVDSLAFSTVDGRKEFGIASNGRIAAALFTMLDASHDPLFRQAALNNCHWLLLRQNSDGYYDGPFVTSRTGKSAGHQMCLDGLLAVRPLISAYQTTKSNIFIAAANRIVSRFIEEILPLGQTPCLYGVEESANCQVALSAAVHALLDVYEEAPVEPLKTVILEVADWFGLGRFDDIGHSCFNYDGSHSGVLECVSAALRLYALTGKQRWFTIAHTLTEYVVAQPTVGWRLADIAVDLLLCSARMIPEATVDPSKLSATVSWLTYSPDTAAALYYEVRDGAGDPVDFLPLVCKQNAKTLILILAPDTVSGIHLIKRNQTSSQRLPLFDAVTREQCTMDIPLHPILDLGWHFAAIRIDP